MGVEVDTGEASTEDGQWVVIAKKKVAISTYVGEGACVCMCLGVGALKC